MLPPTPRQFIFGHLTILQPGLPAQSLSQKPSSFLERSVENPERTGREGQLPSSRKVMQNTSKPPSEDQAKQMGSQPKAHKLAHSTYT